MHTHLFQSDVKMLFALRRICTCGVAVLLALLAGCATFCAKNVDESVYEDAVHNAVRTDEDRTEDVTRKSVDFLRFCDVRPGMQVLDVSAGAGFTTQLLALVVGEHGHVWAQVPKVGPRLQKRLSDHPQANISLAVQSFNDPVPADAPRLDLITIILNYHDIAYMDVDRAQMDARLFAALKTGGHLVIIDHSAKPGTGTNDTKTLHRIDEAVVLAEMRKA